jgi:LysR family transcriptional regulator, glycine cleavage system transcriptional activator
VLPTLPGLEAFEATLRHKSFTKAAQELHVTQSAISHRIRALESQLDCALFVRSARRLELTDEGRMLSVAVRDAFALLREACGDLERARGGGVLTISCSPSFAIRFLVPHLPDFRARHPEIDVRIAADDRLVDPGREGIDACVRYGAGDYAGVDLTRLAIEKIFPVASPQLIDHAKIRKPEDLSRVVLLHDEVLRDHPGRVGWRGWLEAAGVRRSFGDKGPRFSHAHMAIEAAIAGQGVALGRTTLVARDLAEGRLVRPFELELESALAYWLVAPRGASPPKRVSVFRDWLLASARAPAVLRGPDAEKGRPRRRKRRDRRDR